MLGENLMEGVWFWKAPIRALVSRLFHHLLLDHNHNLERPGNEDKIISTYLDACVHMEV